MRDKYKLEVDMASGISVKKTDDIDLLIHLILEGKKKNSLIPYIVGISGIDGSGKGYISSIIKSALIRKGYSVHVENLDGWLNLPEVRFSSKNPANTFYANGFRIDELVEKILRPYIKNRTVFEEVDYIEETWTTFQKKEVKIDEVDIFILEGIFIFQKKILEFLAFSIWVECAFDIALERAMVRNQEGLTRKAIEEVYKSMYFPAQRIHFELDNPIEKANVIFVNDKRIG